MISEREMMQDFESRLVETLKGSVMPMDEVLRYVGAVSGKRLRPRLVFLSAQLFGEVNETVFRTALFVELLHTATLIHDDVVDESDTRRGQLSVNAKWNNTTAVLAGDFLLSKAMFQLSEPSESNILKEMLSTAMAMSEGELLQNEKSSIYLDIITRKTARLIRSCCVGGAMSVEASKVALEKIGDFGLNLGIVFQMRDDIIDDDDPETTALAKRLLPEYLDRALKAVGDLKPLTKDAMALKELRELTMFCAKREI